VASARFLVALLVVGVVVELGIRLEVRGHNSITLPWRLVYRLPLFNNILPVRISMFVALGAGVCVAWWASSGGVPRAVRVGLTGLAIASVVPTLWLTVWHWHPYRPAFFTQGTYRTCLKPDDNVLMLPFPDRSDAMLWQAEAQFRFRMADGYVNTAPPPGVPHPEVQRVPKHRTTPTSIRPLIRWARGQGVTKILVAGGGAPDWVRLLRRTERRHQVGGVYLYNLRSRGGRVCR
jgi:hypothetical protein